MKERRKEWKEPREGGRKKKKKRREDLRVAMEPQRPKNPGPYLQESFVLIWSSRCDWWKGPSFVAKQQVSTGLRNAAIKL